MFLEFYSKDYIVLIRCFMILLVIFSTSLVKSSAYAVETTVHGNGSATLCGPYINRPGLRRSARRRAIGAAKDNARANCTRRGGRVNAVSVENVECSFACSGNGGASCNAVAVAYCEI